MSDAAGESSTPAPPDGLLKHRAFLWFWTSRVLMAMGFQITSVAIGWRIYEMTGSAYALGFVGLVQFLPMLALTLVSGHVADRYDRRMIVIICQFLEAATLAFLVYGIFAGWTGVFGIYAAVALLGAAQAFVAPTLSAMLPAVVPTALLPRAMAMSSSAFQTAMIVGPSAGGVLYAFGAPVPFIAAGVCFLVGALATIMIRVERRAPSREPVTLKSVFGGLTFIWGRPVVLGTISLDLFAVLLGGVVALLPIFAKDILQTGPWGLGLLRAMPAVGALAMAAVLTKYNVERGIGMKMFWSVIIFGVATVIFALSVNLWLSLVALFVLGAADNVSVVIRTSLVLLQTPDEMRGRVNAVNFLAIGTSNQLGEFWAGMMGGLMGVVVAGALGGTLTIAVTLLWMKLFPDLRKADRYEVADD
ncbi:MFS transporter [Emcibacter sp. SYSU 3D8]|uniref:MFS transporter n=1 Tax=Emcibacter sp. SYSU 3D8 TaxID=3133969 RepID=UPI0031FF2985